MIFKSLWAHKKQNGWIFAEIAIISCLSWFMVDYLVTSTYATYFCIPAGEFEKDHLCVGQFDIVRSESASEGWVVPEEEGRNVYVIRDKLKSLPEVASVCLTPDYLNADLRLYRRRTLALADDTTKHIGVSQRFYYQNEHYFETQGLKAIEGSPDAETLSREIPTDGIVVTRSVARMLFGHDQVVGKRLAMVGTNYSDGVWKTDVAGYNTISGVVEDVKASPNERYPYTVFFPNPGTGASPRCQLLLRLKPDANANEFVKRLTPTLTSEFRAGICILRELETYQQHYESQMARDQSTMSRQWTVLPLALFGIIVALGTLGTWWLQIRKRTEDIGIMRSLRCQAPTYLLDDLERGSHTDGPCLHRGLFLLVSVCHQLGFALQWRCIRSLRPRNRLGVDLLAALPHCLRHPVPPAPPHRHPRHGRAHVPCHVQTSRRSPAS